MGVRERVDGKARSARRSRLDPIVAEGGDVYLFVQRDVPGWAEGLGSVHPHVHAKALSVDGRTCTVGSANLDVTASYWESEILLVVEDGAEVHELEAKIAALMAASARVDRDDPAWQRARAASRVDAPLARRALDLISGDRAFASRDPCRAR